MNYDSWHLLQSILYFEFASLKKRQDKKKKDCPCSVFQMTSLQVVCCQSISSDIRLLKNFILDDLNVPCMNQLAQYLSLIDLLRLRPYLIQRGIPTDFILNNLHSNICKHVDSFPIKATTCPHLLYMFQSDNWQWALSRLLYRRLIVRMVEETALNSTLNPAEIFCTILAKKDLLELLQPKELSYAEKSRHLASLTKLCVNSVEIMETCLETAAKNIYYILVDQNVCKFLMDKRFEYILNGFCNSVKALSVLLKSSEQIVHFVKYMINAAKQLDKLCLYAIKTDDLDYFDEILALCSGVIKLCDVDQQQTKDDLYLQSFQTDDTTEHNVSDNKLETPSSCESPFDLMDDAVLFNASHKQANHLNSHTGMSKADFKATNLVEKAVYVPVLTHHLSHWMALRELHLGLADLQPQVTRCICGLIQRPQFKSLTLSSADFKYEEIEDILLAVANRNGGPMEKLMFVSMNVKWDSPEDLNLYDKFDHNLGDTEVEDFLKAFESQRLSKFKEFNGTNLFEWYSCTMGLRVECLIRQYLTKDRALSSVCFSNSVFRQMMTITLRTISPVCLSLSQVIITDWRVISSQDCNVLTQFLRSISSTLESLNLSNSFVLTTNYAISDIWDALSSCKKLTHLDMSSNNLADKVLSLVTQVHSNTNLQDLSLRRNLLGRSTVNKLMTNLYTDLYLNDKRLHLLDLRENDFSKTDLNVSSDPQVLQKICQTIMFPD